MRMSEYEAFIHFLGSYAGWLKQVHDIICSVGGGHKEIDSCEELMLVYTMNMLHSKKWGGNTWVREIEVYS
jgi:hypothetical protein